MDLNSTLATTYSVRSDFSSFPRDGVGEDGGSGKKDLKEMGKKCMHPFPAFGANKKYSPFISPNRE